MDGQFGVNYLFKKFTFGFFFLCLFENNVFINGDDDSGIKFSELNNKVISVLYVMNFGQDIEFMFYVLYRFIDNYNFFEGMGVFMYKNFISVGGFYCQDYGLGFFVRFCIKGKMEIGYGYEFVNNQVKSYMGGFYEVQFKLRMGKKIADFVIKCEG